MELRNKLERTIVEARDVAETGARVALEALAVHHHEPYGHMSPEERKLRNHLRAKARQLGDKQNRNGELEITHLVWECAYEHWHRMLFARFLAENTLLIESEMGVAISLEECEELAKEEGKDLWMLASEFAQGMLPQIFRPDDPVLRVTFASEHRLKLEKLLNDLEPAIFTASDSLGWVYQFWQSKRKREVNKSGNKIGADEIPAVTQIFTEPYMVNFLIHNTLGAWWAGKVLAENPSLAENAGSEEELRQAVSVPGVSWEYLRFIRTNEGKDPWSPAAGIFDNWPKTAAELKIIDPCCGSGHFLVAVLHHLVPLRSEEEGFSAREAVDAVLSDNLYAIEIDMRCAQIAAFALALSSWSYPDTGGFRPLQEMNIACSGVAPNTKKDEWMSPENQNARIKNGIERLYNLFRKAPILGSLIDPSTSPKDDLFIAEFQELRPIFEEIIKKGNDEFSRKEMGISAIGITAAGFLLSKNYHLVITNVPYLRSSDQNQSLKEYCFKTYPNSKHNLGTCFLQRCLKLSAKGGTVSMVTPENWLFLTRYTNLRQEILKETSFNILANLGTKAFTTPMWDFGIALVVMSNESPKDVDRLRGVDVTGEPSPSAKASLIKSSEIHSKPQIDCINSPDSRITFASTGKSALLNDYAICPRGIVTGDNDRWIRQFWEVRTLLSNWRLLQGSVSETTTYGGRDKIIDWSTNGKGMLRPGVDNKALGHSGVNVSLMNSLPATLYTGEFYDQTTASIVPYDMDHLLPIWSFCTSKEFHESIRGIDRKLNVTPATLLKVEFDLEFWTEYALREYPEGIPQPYSKEPTQWLFDGDVATSLYPLHVAIVKMMGFCWPNQAKESGNRIKDQIEDFIDEDGIVCIPSVRGEEEAGEHLRCLLSAVFGEHSWSLTAEMKLIKATGSKTDNLNEWLRNDFFEQHCKRFHHRPFIWHIWDGRRRDGFHALVNYHKLAEGDGKGRQLLESLTYSYLGDWITRQKDGVKRSEGGAEDRLAAALELQKRLIAIIEGESPFDIFVRWKPIEEQPIGWEPDINDGARLNIRPFMAQDIPGGRKGTGVLRWKPNIKWNKDRGKEPYRPQEQYPWFWADGEFTGDRVNDIHLSINDKQKARKEKKQT
jgi:hypothetical protein